MKKSIVFILYFIFLFEGVRSQIPAFNAAIYDSSKTAGYYFLVPNRINSPNLGFHAQLVLDKYGDVVYYKPLGATVNTPDFKVQPNGMITYFMNQQFYLLDSTFIIVDSVKCKNGIITDSHDLQILNNGHYLLLGFEYAIMDLSAYAWFTPAGTHGSATANVKCNVIQELDANKNVVFEWHTKDFFSFADVDSVWLSSPTNVDWTHCNAIEQDIDGNILLSSRHFNQINKINRADSSIIWRMGGNQNQFSFLNDTIPFYGQHDIRRINNGNITLLDDGFRVNNQPYHACRALEYQIDEINKTGSLVWEYIYDPLMFSRATGNNQRLLNGNSLVNFGTISRNNVTFVVVDSLKNKVFELSFADTMSSYRAFNFQQLPWMFYRPEVTCIDSAGNFYLDAGAGYSSYNWSNGETNRIIPVSSADTFFVFVPYGNNGYISSEKLIVTNANDPCNFISSTAMLSDENKMEIYPNPVTDKIYISCGGISASNGAEFNGAEIEVYNLMGELVQTVQLHTANCEQPIETDIHSLIPGIYLLRVTTSEKVVTFRFIKN